MSEDLQVNDDIVIPAAQLRWTAVRAPGPGGQNVNKVATKIQLRFDFEASDVLPAAVKSRLRKAAATKLDASGRLVISSSATRSQVGNLEDARNKLAELIREALVVPKARRRTKPSLGAKRRRLADKRAAGEKKAGRGRRSGDE